MKNLDQITPLKPASTNRADEIVRKLETIIAESTLQAGTSLGTKEDLPFVAASKSHRVR